MTPKQQRVILVGDDRASGHGIICKTCKGMHIGTQESYMRKDESLCTSPVLKRGMVTFSGDYCEYVEVGIVAWVEGFCGVDVHNVNIPPNRMHI